HATRHPGAILRGVTDRRDPLQINLGTGECQRQGEGVVDVGADVEIEEDRHLFRLGLFGRASDRREEQAEEDDRDPAIETGGVHREYPSRGEAWREGEVDPTLERRMVEGSYRHPWPVSRTNFSLGAV